MTPYYSDDLVTVLHGKHEDILPTLGLTFDLIVADPPYGETSLEWDHWPDGWPSLMQDYGRSMWCFGSLRMFLDRRDEFGAWRMSQDVVWRKHAGSSFASDRFKRVHEHAVHWYRHRPGRRPREARQDGRTRGRALLRRRRAAAHDLQIEARMWPAGRRGIRCNRGDLASVTYFAASTERAIIGGTTKDGPGTACDGNRGLTPSPTQRIWG